MRLNHFSRFAIVGVSNAVLHFGVLNFAFSILGASKLASSILATVCAMSYSFLLNKHFVFKSKASVRREALMFVIVTITGVLILHNLIFALMTFLLTKDTHIINKILSILDDRISRDIAIINLSTLFAAFVAMVWNYFGYKNFVFTRKEVLDDFHN